MALDSFRLMVVALCILLCLSVGCGKSGESDRRSTSRTVAVASATPVAAAAKIHVAGLLTDQMNYFAAQQAHSNWCWAACIQMVLKTRGIELSQDQIVRRAFGNDDDVPGGLVEIAQNLDGWQVRRGNGTARLTATCGFGKPPLEVLCDLLSHGIPVLVVIEPESGEVGHAVVVTAVIYEDTPAGPGIRSLMIRDPDPTLSDSEGKRKLSPKEYEQIAAYLRVAELKVPQDQ